MSVKYLEDGKPENRKPYAWRSASVTIAAATADTDITTVTGFETMFTQLARSGKTYPAHYVKISTSGTAYFRLNNSTSDVITVTATTPFESSRVALSALYVTTGGGAITITVQLH